MSSPNRAPEAPAIYSVPLENGHTLSCPAYPADCTWASITLDVLEIYRTNAEAFRADAFAELTRLADALIPGRAENPDLPQPADQDPWDWEECAVAAPLSGRTIRFDLAPNPVDSLRVSDGDGEEVAYWSSTEFEEDPFEVLGAAIGALGSTEERP
jgi:hypothetical protein